VSCIHVNVEKYIGVRSMLSQTAYRAVRLSGIVASLAIIAASSPALANSSDNIATSNPTLTISLDDVNVPALKLAEALPVQPAAHPVVSETPVPKIASNLVNPTDRKAQVLNRLNDRHKCGITNSTVPISRSDFSKKVGVCLHAIEVKLAQEPGALPNEDLEMLKEITAAFRDEIDILANDLAVVNERITAQNTSSFSTTTKLAGEIIIGLSGFGSAPAPNSSSTVFTDRVRLNFDTSFTGKDRLRTRIQARDGVAFNTAVTGTNTTRLGFDGGDATNSSFVSLLSYSLPLSNQAKLVVETVGAEYNDELYNFNPLLQSSGSGAVSRFGRFNPVYRQSNDGAAVILDYKISDQFTGSIGYAVPGVISATPTAGAGFLSGSNSLFSQLRFQPTPNLDFGLVYARSYSSGGNNISGGTGTALADAPFGTSPTTANSYNILASAKISPGFVLSGWAGLTNATRETAAGGSADIFNYAITAAFPDFGAKGNVLGFIFGAPPKVTGNSGAGTSRDTANPLHIEALYKIKFSDNIDITPGVFLISNPTTAITGSEYVGTIRTTFKF
jgi:Carbohydrate-selective porin, OprB family